MYKERIGEGKLTTEMLIAQTEFLSISEKKSFGVTLISIRYLEEYNA
jgi:hypothetical protein